MKTDWMKELNAAKLVDGKLYSFEYSSNKTRKPVKGCRHDKRGGIVHFMFDGDEVVALVAACERCGRMMQPERISGKGVKPVTLGKQAAEFRDLCRFIAAH